MIKNIFFVEGLNNKILRRILAFLIVFFMVFQPVNTFAEDGTPDIIPDEEIHYLAFASDRHAPVIDLETGETHSDGIEKSFAGMPEDVEYVCIVGDTVGEMGDIGRMKPVSRSSDVFNEVYSVGFKNANSVDDISILWASHDENMTDDKGIIFADKGYGSGVMKKGLNSDGTAAYYIYGIGFYEMTKEEFAEPAAKEFMEWVDTLEDNTVPIIVLCHVPLHYSRGDNNGAKYWNLALNYAATGNATAKSGIKVNRDVLFIHGHNHTIETDTKTQTYSGEYYIPCGSKMEIGVDENDFSTIYYTYTTGGYLKANYSATLVSITEDDMTIEKYQNGAVVDGLYDSESMKSGDFATRFSTAGTHVIESVEQFTPINKEDVSGLEESYEYTGEEICPEIVLPEDYYEKGRNGNIKNYYFTVRYNDNIDAGNASMTITAMAPHFGSVTIPFTITPKEVKPEVTLSETSYTYDGKEKTPEVVVKDGEKLLEKDKDYKIDYAPGRIKEGRYKVDVTLTGNYSGKASAEFEILKPKDENKKDENTLKLKGKTATVKYSRIKKKARTLKVNKVITFTNKGQGTLQYKLYTVKKGKKSFKKYFKINSKTGKVTIKKGLKKGTYRVSVKVSAAGNSSYNPSAVKTVSFKIKVK